MNNRLIDLLLPLSTRERILLGLGVFLVLPVAVLFGLLIPLTEERTQAEALQTEAIALNQWVQDRAIDKRRLDTIAPTRKDGPPIGLAGLEQSLISAKLRGSVSTIGARPEGGVELLFDRVDFRRLTTWLSSSHPAWGYMIDSYRFEATGQPGQVAAAMLLSPR